MKERLYPGRNETTEHCIVIDINMNVTGH